MRAFFWTWFAGVAFVFGPSTASAIDIEPLECLAISSVGRGGRSPVQLDALQVLLVDGTFSAPRIGDKIGPPNMQAKEWKRLERADDGWFSGGEISGGYAFFTVQSSQDQVLILDAAGHGACWVNGVIRGGDPYANGNFKLPVRLKKGPNTVLFSVPRGRLRVRFTTPPSPRFVSPDDPTLPDLLPDQYGSQWAAVVVVNATNETMHGATLWTSGPGFKRTARAVPPILPLGIRKVPIRIQTDGERAAGPRMLAVSLHPSPAGPTSTQFHLRERSASQTIKKTFVSAIDGSVQYYALNPASDLSRQPGLVLSLHGASVEAIGQADAYAPKPWAHIVCPTNRRPYGFDWEDWGRLDALEVLSIAKRELNTDPARTYLTGHSMGGHGTWQLGVTVPGEFAAIAPSAGWISFFSYAGASRDPGAQGMLGMLQRAGNTSDTLALSRNLLMHKIYILHGDKDDNVSVSEARTMRSHLAGFHPNVIYLEQPGAGHWWGNECVDWKPIFELFRNERLAYVPGRDTFEFSTMNPEVSSRCAWITIEQQTLPLMLSTVSVRRNLSGDIDIETKNIARLSIDAQAFIRPGSRLMVDHQSIALASASLASKRTIERGTAGWVQVEMPGRLEKTPQRGSNFKAAFNHRFMLVYGTNGTQAENNWALAKARYDSEVWTYRGNGSVDVIPDTAFEPDRERDRSVILYGNSETNSAWTALLSECPIQVTRSDICAGKRRLMGNDLACLFVRPRPMSDKALVGVVSGTGIRGMRATDRLPYFTSGVGFPDFTVLAADAWTKGIDGFWAAGYFGNDWSFPSTDLVWRQRNAQQ